MQNNQKKLEILTAQKNKWRALPNTQKIHYIDSCMDNLMKVKEKWVELCVEHKKIPKNSQTVGQEWVVGPSVLMRGLRMLKYSLKHNASPPIKITQNTHGQSVAKVLPTNFYESVLFYKMHAEVVIEKNKPATQGEKYRALYHQPGSVCVVLGAGNVASMPALDVIDKLFSHGNVCLLKFNPVNEYLYEIFEIIFKNLIDDGFVALTKGDKTVGEFLCAHELTNEIHLTGSYQTYEALLKYNKPMTLELGCVTPAIIVPGKWQKTDLNFQAKQIASAIENNASFNCNAVKVLVLDKNWAQKEEFLNELRNELRIMATRYAYYPGAQERYNEFIKQYPQSELFHANDTRENALLQKKLPWAFIPNVDIKPNEYALNNEAFCGVLAVVELENNNKNNNESNPNFENPAAFLAEAVNVCNTSIWGTLSCALIIDTETHKKYNTEVENALFNLQYGSIGLNCWAAVSFALYGTTWGGFATDAKQSGIGVINNGYFFDNPEKSIVRVPFRQLLKPIWFYDNKNLVNIGKNLVNFEYSQNFFNFLKLAISGMLG